MINGRGRLPPGSRGTGPKKAPTPEAIEAGERLRALRIEKGQSLGITPPTCKAVAVALGLDHGYMQGAESGWRPISKKRAPKIASKFGVSTEYLLYGISTEDVPRDPITKLSIDQKNSKRTEDVRGSRQLENKLPSNRVEFDLPPWLMDRLNALKLKTDASSFAEVVRSALRVYEALIEDVENGVPTPYRLLL